MKIWIVFTVSFWITITSQAACDSYLQYTQKDPRKAELFKKDCDIQDRYNNVRSFFNSIGINVADIAEYRMLRFIDRSSFEHARQLEITPSQIYKPAPMTWEVWDGGIRSIFRNDDLSFSLFITGGFDSRMAGYEHLSFSYFNAYLLKNSRGDVSRDKLNNVNNRDSAPGTYRQAGDSIVGWTSVDPQINDQITQSQLSMRAAQARWESSIGVSFSTIVDKYKGANAAAATFAVPMIATKQGSGFYVAYSPSDMVPAQISWIHSFIKENLDRYRLGKAVMPPIELSALVQKWLVTIHPFSDGNGRTSRAVQDVILANFKMPYAPGGDLQNDTLDIYDTYVDKTYAAMDSMVKKLEMCAEEYRQKTEKPSYGCRTVQSME